MLPDGRCVRRPAAHQAPDPEQAAYHFISGYTAKLAGTEVGVMEPKATFSRVLRGAVHAPPPGRVRRMLTDRLAPMTSTVWLMNTGWTGGPYGTG